MKKNIILISVFIFLINNIICENNIIYDYKDYRIDKMIDIKDENIKILVNEYFLNYAEIKIISIFLGYVYQLNFCRFPSDLGEIIDFLNELLNLLKIQFLKFKHLKNSFLENKKKLKEYSIEVNIEDLADIEELESFFKETINNYEKIIYNYENKDENLNKNEILIDEIANLLTEEEQCAI